MPAPFPTPTPADLARELIRYKMLEYSENSHCAYWLIDLDFTLWNAAEISEPLDYQRHTARLSSELRVLAEMAGGWWVYEDESHPDEQGPVFIPMERWLTILGARCAR